jgi:hypothetical protein
MSIASNAFSTVAPNYSAYRDVRVRVTCNSTNCPPSGKTYCSRDNFAVRPQGYTVGSNMTNTVQTGLPRLAAGADFSLTVTAVPGYNGAPQLDRATKVATHVGPADFTTRLRNTAGASPIAFPAAPLGTGVSATTVQYHDAGNFQVLADGITDSSFTSVDTAGTDCVAGSSSNSDNDGNANNGLKYGCNVGNQSTSSLFGRFFPAYYVLSSPSFAAACTAGGYSYMGDAHIGLGFTISAMSQDNPGGATLKLTHYTSGYGTLASVNVAAADGTTLTDRSGSFSPSLAYNAGNWALGDYAISGSSYSFARTTPSGPYDSLYIAAGVNDADGAVLAAMNFAFGDPNCTGVCTHRKLSAGATKVRFGRLQLQNGHGSQRLDLSIPVEAQYWTGSIWQRNTLDNCTSLPAASFALGNYSGLTNSNMPASNLPATATAVSSGLGSLLLKHPTDTPPAQGRVDIAVDLGSTPTPSTCSTFTNPNANPTGAGLAHLRGQWCAGGYIYDPVARATFGIYRNRFIYLRENH